MTASQFRRRVSEAMTRDEGAGPFLALATEVDAAAAELVALAEVIRAWVDVEISRHGSANGAPTSRALNRFDDLLRAAPPS